VIRKRARSCATTRPSWPSEQSSTPPRRSEDDFGCRKQPSISNKRLCDRSYQVSSFSMNRVEVPTPTPYAKDELSPVVSETVLGADSPATSNPGYVTEWPPANRPPKVDFYVVATTGLAHPKHETGLKGVWKKTRRSYHYGPGDGQDPAPARPPFQSDPWKPSHGFYHPSATGTTQRPYYAQRPPFATGQFDGNAAVQACEGNFAVPTVIPASLTLVWSSEEIPSLMDLLARTSGFSEGCYGCGCLGHSQNGCPLRKCGRCSSYGHSEKNCQTADYRQSQRPQNRPNVGERRPARRDYDDRSSRSEDGTTDRWRAGGSRPEGSNFRRSETSMDVNRRPSRNQSCGYRSTGDRSNERYSGRSSSSDGRADVADWRTGGGVRG
jgi:hypothetical protein